VEGAKSLDTDPANYSAHRFLADSYSGLPRRDIARVSELLQAQLLQPLNVNPVQPSLAQKTLSIPESAGPSSASFNEFNPLFLRNRIALQASGVAGSQDTFGEEVVLSGLQDRFSFSLGQYHFRTDGFRENADLTNNIYSVFAQASLSPKTSIFAEYRAFDSGHGDLELDFLADDFFRNIRYSDQYKGGRIGVHHAFAPGSDLIGTAVYDLYKYSDRLNQRVPFDVDAGVDMTFDINDQTADHTADVEIQQILRWSRYHLVAGAGYLHIDRDLTSNVLVTFDPPIMEPIPIPEVLDSTIQHTNAYVYFHVRYPESVNWTVGASGDFYRESTSIGKSADRNQFNPKFGLTWTPRPGTTIRGALFRVLRRTLPVNSQTIEPTQVAGFNQFYDDYGGTDAWTYGVGADQKIADSLFAGAEYYQRDLDVPITITDLSGVTNSPLFDWTERQGRAYVSWAPDPRLALSADFLYEHQDRDGSPGTFKKVTTSRVPLSARFFHPSGLFATATGTFFDQSGEFWRIGQAPSTDMPTSGSDQFWIFDASVGYRLPKRYGIVSLEGRNLFNRSFNYQDTGHTALPNPASALPTIQPGRTVYFKITISL
jgi:hypothetical protein